MHFLDLLKHFTRVVLSKTTQRNVEHEMDEVEPVEPPLTGGAQGTQKIEVAPEPQQPLVPALLPIEESPAVEPPSRGLALLSIGVDGWLIGDKVVRVPTERVHAWRSKSGQPLGALWHWTSTAHGTALTMAKRIVKRPGTSVHAWLESDGTIYQSAPFTRSTGHAGGATAKRVSEHGGMVVFDPKSRLDMNSFVLGFEIVCVGEVRPVAKLPDGSYSKSPPELPGTVFMGWPFGRWETKKDNAGKPVLDKSGKPVRFVNKGPIVRADQVAPAVDEDGIHRFYHQYTPAQVEAAERMVRAMRDRYGWTDAHMAWGHIDSDPTRKSDPGPLWRKKWLPEIFKRSKEGL